MRLRTTHAHPPTYCTNRSRSAPLFQRVKVLNFVRRTDWLAVHFPKDIPVLPVRHALLSRVPPLMAGETVCQSSRESIHNKQLHHTNLVRQRVGQGVGSSSNSKTEEDGVRMLE